MGVDAGSVYTSIRIRLTDLDNDLKGVYSRLDQLEAKIAKTTVPAKKNFKDMFAAVVTGQAALGLAKKGFELLVSSIKNSINVASESQEMISKYGEVFDGMGGQAEDAAKRFADSFDLAGATAKEMLANTGNLLQGMGATKEESLDMSVSVNTLAADLASFTNNQGGASAASEAITKALLGEKESMKTLGIAILDSDVNARVAKNGQSELTGTALKLAKAQATLQLITEQASNAIGDYARTSDSVANSQKRAAERTKELQIAIGTGLGGAVKLASNLWSGFAEGLTKVINRSSSIGKLTGATDNLIASSREYNTITNTLTSSSNNLSEAERGVLNARKDLLAQQISQQAIELAKAYKDEYTALGKAENKTKGLTSEQSGLIKKQDELKQNILNVDKIWSTLTESEKDAYRSLSDSSGKYTSVVEKDEAAKIYITSLYRDSLTLVQRKIGEVNSKLIDSTNTTNTFKNKNQEALYAIARAVNDGTISIAQFSGTSNAGYTKFYNDVMAATVEVKKQDAAQKALADAEQDAAAKQEAADKNNLTVSEQITARKKALKEYTKDMASATADYNSGVSDQKKYLSDSAAASKKYADALSEAGYSADEASIGGRALAEQQKKLIEYGNSLKDQNLKEYYSKLSVTIGDSTSDIDKQLASLEKSRQESLKNAESFGLVGDALQKVKDDTNAAYDALRDKTVSDGINNVTKAVDALTTKQLSGVEASNAEVEASRNATIKEIQDKVQVGEAQDELIKKVNEYYDALKDDEAIKAFRENVSDAISTVSSTIGSIGDLVSALYDRQEDLLEQQKEDELEAAGVSEETAVETAQAKYDAAVAEGDAETIAEAQKALKKAQIEEDYTKKLAELQYQSAMVAWGFQLTQTTASAAMSIINAFNAAMQLPGPVAIVSAPVYEALAIASGAASVAAVAAAMPVKSYASGGIVAPSSSGTIVRVAENGSAEGIFNAGESGKALIDSFTSSMLKNMGTNNNSQTIILKVDGTTLAKIVTRKQRNGD